MSRTLRATALVLAAGSGSVPFTVHHSLLYGTRVRYKPCDPHLVSLHAEGILSSETWLWLRPWSVINTQGIEDFGDRNGICPPKDCSLSS